MPRDDTLLVKLLHSRAPLPSRAHPGDAGLDLTAVESTRIYSGTWRTVSCGVAIAVPPGHVGLIWPRSGTAVRSGIDVLAGCVDAGYRGEVKAVLINHGARPHDVAVGDRVAQLLVLPCWLGDVTQADELPPSERGEGGFGSSGMRATIPSLPVDYATDAELSEILEKG